MTTAKIKAIINALPKPEYLYGFRLSSGKEIILTRALSPDEATGDKAPDKLIFDDGNGIIKIAQTVSTAWGPQAKIARFVDANDVIEVMTFYDPKKDGQLENFGN